MHIPYPSPLESPLAVSYRNHQKNLAYFSHLAPLVLFFFTKRQSQKGGGGAWHNGPAPKCSLFPMDTPIMCLKASDIDAEIWQKNA